MKPKYIPVILLPIVIFWTNFYIGGLVWKGREVNSFAWYDIPTLLSLILSFLVSLFFAIHFFDRNGQS
jgi:hypothetical protein